MRRAAILVALIAGVAGVAALALRDPAPARAPAAPAHLGTPVRVEAAAPASVRAVPEPGSNQAAVALGATTDPAAAPMLIALATSPSESVSVRANAARALGAAGGSEHAAALAALVAGDAPLRVRQEAALSLARIGGADEAPALVAALDTAADEQLRISIIQGLGGLDAPAARDALVAHARRDLSPTERAFLDRALR